MRFISSGVLPSNMKRRRIALVFEQSQSNSTLSYQHGWPKAFIDSSLFDCKPINLAGKSLADEMAIAWSFHREKYDAIVLLHSVFSNQQNLRGLAFRALSLCRVPKAFFISNEYKLMPEKIRFCRHLGIDLLISQSNDQRVLSMYRQALGCCVDSVPNTGFDMAIFRPQKALQDRCVDIGYRAFEAPWYLGNNEKTEIADLFIEKAREYKLSIDISLDPAKRFNAPGYTALLNNCRGQIGTEAGGDYFEPDEHYISLKKDGSNFPDVLERFRHDAYCERITSNAYDVAMAELTYEKLVEKFSRALSQVFP